MTAELIARLESATGPDRELDGRIYCAVKGKAFVSVGRDGGCIHFEPDEHGTHTMLTPHPFTGSVDVAFTLVPEGWRVDWLQHSLDEDYWTCGLYMRGEGRTIHRCHASGTDAARALSAAALKARGVP